MENKYTFKGIEDAIDKLHEKIDGIDEKICSIKNTVLKNTISLEEHMKRTDLSEKRLEIFEEKVLPALNAYKFLEISVKILVPLLSVAGIIYEYFK